jgi:SsrA-binding protein
VKIVSLNRRAYHDYDILENIEAGIALQGTEVKSVREGKIDVSRSFARVEHGELWLMNSHISYYDKGNRYNHEVNRPRKLLLHRREINDLGAKLAQKRLTLIPLRVYIKDRMVKVDLGLARGRKLYDKRRSITQKEVEREAERALKYALQRKA